MNFNDEDLDLDFIDPYGFGSEGEGRQEGHGLLFPDALDDDLELDRDLDNLPI